MKSEVKIKRKLTGGILTIVMLAICLCITSFALVYATVSVENNLFQTGNVSINLNDGKPIIQEHEFLFEPGVTVEKQFFIQNESSCEVYYRLYFEHTDGALANLMEITITTGEKTLYNGTAAQLTQENTLAAEDMLRLHEYRDLTIFFHFPENVGNDAQGQYLTFDLCAQAVQTKNNPDKLFD